MRPFILTLSVLFLAQTLNAQQWTALNPPDNIFNNIISTTVIDRVGTVYAAGQFTNSQHKNVVAVLSGGGKWVELGGVASLQASGIITSLATDAAGNLIAAGGFTDATGNIYIAKWDGTRWIELGTGSKALNPNGVVYSIATDPTGNVYAGGGFTDTAGNYYVVKWDGSTWSPLGSGSHSLKANGLIYSIKTDAAGNVYAAGQFTNSGGKYYVAKWDGTAWTELGSGAGALNANSYINSIAVDAAGRIYAAGDFSDNNGYRHVALWNGTSWSLTDVGSSLFNDAIQTIVIDKAQVVYAAGRFADISGANFVATFNGVSWAETAGPSGAGTPGSTINSVSVDSAGNIYAAGAFKDLNGDYYVAKWDGQKWNEPGLYGAKLPPTNQGLTSITVDKAGYVYVTGSFNTVYANNPVVERWDGTGWSQPGDGGNSGNANGTANCVLADDKYVYLAGNFEFNNHAYYLAKWDGVSWSEVGDFTAALQPGGPVSWIAKDGKGNIYISGSFTVNNISYGMAKWDGTGWQAFASTPGTGPSYFITDMADNMYISDWGGVTGGVSEFTKNGWVGLGGLRYPNYTDRVNVMAIDSKGYLYAGGSFTDASDNSYVMKWDGQSWTILDSSVSGLKGGYAITGMVVDSADNVYAAGGLARSGVGFMGKWNGKTWSRIELPWAAPSTSSVSTMTLDGKGNLYAAGGFSDERGYYYVAEYHLPNLSKPLIGTLPASYCNALGVQTVNILNLPDTSTTTVSIRLDNTVLPLLAGGSCSFNVSSLQPGGHQLLVTYSNSDGLQASSDSFQVLAASTPAVKLSANRTSVTSQDGTILLTAGVVSGGGSHPQFVFAADRNFNIILQPLSTANTFTINANQLVQGNNTLYVRMQTSDSCFIFPTATDSIVLTRKSAPGITDIDYPNSPIVVSPNPVGQFIIVTGLNTSKSYSILLLNSLGALVGSVQANGRTEVDIEGLLLRQGTYWLEVYDNTKKRSIGKVSLLKL